METYYITGLQLGILKALYQLDTEDKSKVICDMIDEIIEEQQIDNRFRKG